MATVSTEQQPGAPVAPKRKRGRETVMDMVRSLGIVLLVVVALWYLAQPPDSDEQVIRVIDPSADVTALLDGAPGTPVPGGLPAGWRSTSSTLDPDGLRIGYVTPTGQFTEYAAFTRPEPDLSPQTGSATAVGTVQVEGEPWQQLTDADEHVSLVLEQDGRSVVVGGVRETTSLDELLVLARAVD